MEMPRATILYGALLTVLGVGGYLFTGSVSLTSLIPAFFGVPLIVLGIWGQKPAALKHAMHGAAVLALLGIFGSAGGLLQLPALLSGAEVLRPAAVISRSIMAVISVVFLVLCIRSFIAVRKAREAQARA